MSSPESSDSPQLKLMHTWGQGFTNRDLDLITGLLHKDYHYTLYPRSIGSPEETREEWIARFSRIFSLWTDTDATVRSIIDTPEKVVVHFTNKVKSSIGADVTRESILITRVVPDEDGSLKIQRLEEFTDSKAHLDFLQAVVASKAKK